MLKRILILLCMMVCAKQLSAQSQKPNIIFILADDLGYGDIGRYGQKLIQTPNIDQLSREGLTFTNFYAGAPVCSPSRSVLMTGLNTGHTTVRGNNTKQGGNPGKKGAQTIYRANLSDKDFTIGNLLQQSGYTTAMAGKWHLDGYDSLATPLHRGFDKFSGWLINYPETYSNGYWPAQRYIDGKLVEIEKNRDHKKGSYSDLICTEEAIDFLAGQQNAKKPFMLMVNYNLPHSPLDAPDLSAYQGKNWPENAKIYASMVHQLDQSVARIKNYLVQTGLSKNTIVFFCSDNGPRSENTKQLSEVADFFNSNGDLRGFKRDMYDGGIRVPMIVWAPGLVKAGTISTTPAYFADIMPTFAGISNTKTAFKSDGINLFPLLKGQKTEEKPRFLYWEFFENGFEQAVRYGKWKAVKHTDKLELYDLDADISEQNDIAAGNPTVVQQIEQYLTTARTDSPFWPIN
ncbi:arylsulfatase [Dyadobacter diqingensis]|uniref:arylsulfatase n=1 Tax=Dyadobacter diqingensis TaxID=2938121 RepID=UPI0020C4F87E|nr:arylsulfatase [Dyadobacter diqingensis]